MCELAIMVDDYIKSHGVRKTWICEQLSIKPQSLRTILNKKNFTVDDANRILAPLNVSVQVSYKIM